MTHISMPLRAHQGDVYNQTSTTPAHFKGYIKAVSQIRTCSCVSESSSVFPWILLSPLSFQLFLKRLSFELLHWGGVHICSSPAFYGLRYHRRFKTIAHTDSEIISCPHSVYCHDCWHELLNMDPIPNYQHHLSARTGIFSVSL